MSVFMLCEQSIGLLRGKRLILSDSEKSMLERLDYAGLTENHAQDEACVCALHFQRVRDNLLQNFPWVFARKSDTPAQLSESSAGWKFAFALPSDCLKVQSVMAEDNRINFYNRLDQDLSEPPELNELLEWEEADGRIYANRSPIHIRYTYKNTNVDSWAASFIEAFVIKLAEAVLTATGASADLIKVLESNFQQVIQIAVSNGIIKAETGLPKQRETRPIDDYGKWGGYSGLNRDFNWGCICK